MSDRLFVSIAVSKPEKLEPLPGAITAARRMAHWAKLNGYSVEAIDDSDGTPVTVQRIREQVRPAIDAIVEESRLSRLIFFFAGHGSARTVNDNYWLLSRWHTNASEAINLTALQRVLRTYGQKQVTLIGDCCSVTHKAFLDVIGSAVLDRLDEDDRQYELDRFLAADAGEASFMIKAEGSQDAFCVFTEVLLDALEGDAPGAFDADFAGQLVVTSGSLTQHLNEEVPVAASRHKVAMTPKPEPGYYTDRVYVRFDRQATGHMVRLARDGESVLASLEGVGKVLLETVDPADARRDRDRLTREMDGRIDAVTAIQADFNPGDIPTHFETQCGLAVLGAGPVRVEAARGEVLRDPQRPGIWFPVYPGGSDQGRDWTDLIVDLGDGRAASVCAVSGFVATLQIHSPAHASLIHRPIWENPGDPDAMNLLARANAGLLGGVNLVDIAALLRNRKHADFTIGCIAAYLYDSIGDIESIRSIAAFYKMMGQIVPLDVALLSGGRIHTGPDGRLLVDIPATPDREPRSEIERERRFTYDGTPSINGAPVGGLAPWLRSGWGVIESAHIDDSAAAWRVQALGVIRHLTPSPFSMVGPDGREALAKLVRVVAYKPEPEKVGA